MVSLHIIFGNSERSIIGSYVRPLSPGIKWLILLALLASFFCISATAEQVWTPGDGQLDPEVTGGSFDQGTYDVLKNLAPESAVNLSSSVTSSLGPYREVKILNASDKRTRDRMGYWHSISICGDVAVAGAMLADSEGLVDNGQAYIFERNAGGPDNWGQVKILTASDAANNASFGYSTAISGNTIVVGAYRANSRGKTGNGQAYVFERDAGGPGNWGQVAILYATDAEDLDHFGTSAGISGDVIIVCALRQYPVGSLKNGQVYVFERDAGGPANWGLVKVLTPDNQTERGQFGLSGYVFNGTIAVSELQKNRLYIFERNAGGTAGWGKTKVITAPVDGDAFGSDLSLSGDYVVASAPGASDNQGRAYVFERNNGGLDNWGNVAVLAASDSRVVSEFGTSVSISGDTVVVGAPYASERAYVFEKDAGGAGIWGQAAILSASDMANRSGFGWSVACSGKTVVVGAPDAYSSGNIRSGQAYVFEPSLMASFSAKPTIGTTPLAVTFSDTSAGRITGWLWDFGDGSTATDQDPVHTFTEPGVYTVILAISGPDGTDIIEKPNYITVGTKPQLFADFTVSPVSGTAPLTVKCSDQSVGSPTRYIYNFGDGTNMTGPNPVHTYRFPGIYDITLTITKFDKKSGSMISSNIIKKNIVTVSKVPFTSLVASFTAAPVNGIAPLEVSFTDNSTGSPTFYNYDFGDGINLTGPNPIHTYRHPGNYSVTLTVMKKDAANGAMVSNSSVRKDYIVVHGE
jgi:PKD repeat protein